MKILDRFIIGRLQDNSIYSKESGAFLISGNEARIALRMPKNIVNPMLKEYERKGLLNRSKDRISITPYWREIMGQRLNRK